MMMMMMMMMMIQNLTDNDVNAYSGMFLQPVRQTSKEADI